MILATRLSYIKKVCNKNVLKEIDGIVFVSFDENDVVRHTLVKNIIKAYAKSDTSKNKLKKV